ncbi:MAG: nuclear transport factor 2 family protein [Cyclobacteriaceae bacterium]
MMKIFFVSLILAFLVSCSTSDQASSSEAILSDDDYEVLTNLKMVSMAKAYDDQDTVLLDQLLHENYLLVDDGGLTYSKKDELAYVAEYGSSYDSLFFDIKSLEIFKNGTATLFGEGTIVGSDLDGSYSLSYKSTDVFIKENGEWKAISSHVSGTKEERRQD